MDYAQKYKKALEKAKDRIDWVIDQSQTDEKEHKTKVLKYTARQCIKWLNASIPADEMCLSNAECKDIEDAFIKDDWARIFHYMCEKLKKQSQVKKPSIFQHKNKMCKENCNFLTRKLDSNKVIDWLKTHGNLTPIVTIKINEVIDKFKKDFGL